MSSTTESNNSLIKNGVDIRVPNNIYNSFVSTYRSDLLIGPSTINKVQIKDNSIGGKATTINFSSVLTPQLLYSNQVVLQSDVNFTFSNVKVKQDRTAVYTAARLVEGGLPAVPTYVFLATTEAAQTAAMAETTIANVRLVAGISDVSKYTEGISDNYTVRGLSSNPFQVEFAPCTNFLNAYLAQTSSVTLATNGNPVTIQTTPKYLDIHSRGLDEDDVYNNWSGALIPTKSIIRNQRYYAFPKTYGQITNSNGVYCAKDDEDIKRGVTQAFKTVYPTYLDIEKDPNASTNSSNRGKLDKALNVNWKFTKTVASYNFIVSAGATAHVIQIERTPATTIDLNNVVINGYTFPSSFSSLTYSDEELYAILGDILFFTCDQLDPLAKGKVFTADRAMIFLSNEPANQSMTVIKSYEKMQVPLYNPLLSSNKSTACFSNTSLFNTTLTRNQNIRTCIEYIGGVPISTNTTNNNVSMDISIANCQLELTQYSVSAMESAVKNTSRLYFSNYSIAREANKMVKIAPEGMKQRYKREIVSLSQIHIGSDIPRAVMFYLSSGVGSEDELFGYKIVQITAKISSGMGGDATGDRDLHELFRTTREVQLSDYKIEDITGYTVPYKTFTNVNGYGSGSVVVFDSSDFGFSSQILSIGGLSGKSFTISYDLHIDVPTVNRVANVEFNIQAHVYHITSSYIELNNSQATIMNQLFDNDDAVKAIEEFKNHAKSGSMHMSNRRYLGGNVFSKLLKLRHVIPKIYNSIPKVLNGVTNAVQTGHNVLNTVGNIGNTISKTGFFGRN